MNTNEWMPPGVLLGEGGTNSQATMTQWRVTLDGAGSSDEMIQARDQTAGRPLGYRVRGAGAELGGGRKKRQEGERKKIKSQRERQKDSQRHRQWERAQRRGSGERKESRCWPGEEV